MNPEDKNKIKRKIQNRINSTRRSIKSLQEQARPVPPDRAIGRITRMDAIQQKSMSQSNLRSAELALSNSEETLLKLDETDFGLCIRRRKTIPIERILIVPESKCCIRCA